MRNIWLVVCMLFCFILVLAGVHTNWKAMESNGCKMPAKYPINITDERHFTFQEKEQVNNYYYTDLIQTNTKVGIISIGDIFVVFGCLFLLILLIGIIASEVKNG